MHGQRGHELDGEQVRPDVHLVDRGGLDVLDRAGLDDGQQALGVTPGTGADREAGAGGGRRPRRPAALGDGARHRRHRRPPRRLRRRLRRWPWPPRLRSSRWAGILLSPARRPRRRRPRRRRRGGGRVVAAARRPSAASAFCAGLFGSLAEMFGDLGHGASLACRPQSGPEMPPSLRTRQKWMAMKMTMTNGSISTCSTYQRSSVSVPISTPPSSTNRTWLPNTGV